MDLRLLAVLLLQTTLTHAQASCQLNVLCVLDESGSIYQHEESEAVYRYMKDFCGRVVHAIDAETRNSRYGVIEFNNRASVSIALDEDVSYVVRAIDQLTHKGGSTDIIEALDATRRHLMSNDNGAENVVFLVTDGDFGTSGATGAVRDLQSIAEVFVVGIGHHVHDADVQAALALIASPLPSGSLLPRVYEFYDYRDIRGLDVASVVTGEPGVLCYGQGRSCSQEQADIIFVLDQSGSVGKSRPVSRTARSNWEEVVQFLTNFVQNLVIGENNYQISVITFGNDATIEFPLYRYRSRRALVDALESLPYRDQGNTNTSGALREMMYNGFSMSNGYRPSVSKVGILITDGMSTWEKENTIPTAEEARDMGITLLVVGVSTDIDVHEIRSISSEPQRRGETYWLTPSYEHLEDISAAMQTQSCRAPPNTDCSYVDVAILVDSSASVEPHWDAMRAFVSTLIRAFQVGEDAARIALLRFSEDTVIDFYLDRSFTKQEKLKIVEDMEHIDGRTSIAGALRKTRSSLFYGRYGDRSGARNIAFLVTDGRETVNEHELEEEARALRSEDNVEVYTIGIGSSISEEQLQTIATSDDHVFLVEEFDNLQGVVDTVIRGACSPQPAADGRAGCVPDRGYDVLFLVDGGVSSSLESHVTQQIIAIIDNLHVTDGFTRVAMMAYNDNLYSSGDRMIYGFDDFIDDRSALRDASDYARVGGEPSIRAGLREAKYALRYKEGSRSSMVVLMTSGADDMSDRQTINAADDLVRAGVAVHVIGYGDDIRARDVTRLSTPVIHYPSSIQVDDSVGAPYAYIIDRNGANINRIARTVQNVMCDDDLI